MPQIAQLAAKSPNTFAFGFWPEVAGSNPKRGGRISMVDKGKSALEAPQVVLNSPEALQYGVPCSLRVRL